MAATTLSVSAKLQDTTNTITRGGTNVSITTADEHFDWGVRTVGTTEESHTIHADITGGNGPGYLWVKNKDGTNYVELGTATTVYWAKIDAGWEGLIPLNSSITTLFFKANTAACQLEFYVRER